MKRLLQKHNITLYSTENKEKRIVCERWNRKIKTKMWKQFTVQGNTVYLDKILKQYNNTKHSSIKMTPKPRFKIGDKIRISKYKRKVFDKEWTLHEITKFKKLETA